MRNMDYKLYSGLITTGMWLFLSTCAYAQPGNVIEQSFASEPLEEVAEKDIKVGDFIFHPNIGFTQYYDDNIYATQTGENDDTISVLNAELKLSSDWKQHSLGFKLGADANKYSSFDSENTVDNWLNINGHYDTSDNSRLKVTAAYINDHEDRAAPESVSSLALTKFSENQVNFSFDHTFTDLSYKLAASSLNIDFHDSGIINNDTRDRNDNSFGFRLNVSINKGHYIFIQSILENRDYEQAVDLNLFNRDSDIQNHIIGYQFKTSNRLYGELFIGQLSQKFDDIQFKQVSEPDYGARINWHTSSFSKLVFITDRTIEETTLNNSSGFLYDKFLIKFSHGLNQFWSYSLVASLANADYQLISREDDYTSYAVGANYQLEKGLSFGMDYVLMERDSTEDTDDYRRNQLYFRVSAQL